jgi:RHH-type transcriptional regulator, rel operon repressor / antitoxin RelB
MIAVELEAELEQRLEQIARQKGSNPSACVREAILDYLEDAEDVAIATERLENPARTYSAAEVKRELGL